MAKPYTEITANLLPSMAGDTLALAFPCEFCEISKNTFFTKHLLTTASV